MSLPPFPDYVPDEDDPTSVDDLDWREVKSVRLERMTEVVYWLGVEMLSGEYRHVQIFLTVQGGGVRLRARVTE